MFICALRQTDIEPDRVDGALNDAWSAHPSGTCRGDIPPDAASALRPGLSVGEGYAP